MILSGMLGRGSFFMMRKRILASNGSNIWIPIKDEPFGKITICMLSIIIATVFVFLWQYLTPVSIQEQFWFSMSIIDIRPWTLVTHLFLHYPPQWGIYFAIAHIVGNMWFLFLFMNNLEEKIGYYIIPFYIIGGVFASLVFGLVFQDAYLVGASGAVSCCLGAYYMAFPNNKLTLVGVSQENLGDIDDVEDILKLKDRIKYKTVDCKYWLGAWFTSQFALCIMMNTGVAYVAHIAGFVFGVIAVIVFKKIRLFKWLSLIIRKYGGVYHEVC